MNKTEAILAMKSGKKVTHKYFSPDEWMTMIGNTIILFEDGVECEVDEFWSYRTQEYWDDGYSLFD